MKNIFLFPLLLPLAFSACKNERPTEKISQILEEITSEFVPDKRVALFNIDTIVAGNPVIIKGETNLPAAKEEVLKKLGALGIPFADSLILLPSNELEGKTFGIVNVSVCNMRSKRGHSQELATQALLGTPLRVLKSDGNFYLVQGPDDYLGWLDDGGFKLMNQVEYEAWKKADKVVIMEDFIFGYSQADEKSPKVSDLVAGNILKGKKEATTFSRVTFPDGRVAFVKSSMLMNYNDWLASRKPEEEEILKSAFEMMGRPYLWGGTSGKGVDCSGFTKMVYYLNGVQLPRDANQQADVGEDVPSDTTFSNLLPGDLLFFGRKATEGEKERITHVGIYLGNGKMIHSSNMVEIGGLRRGEPDFSEYRLTSFVRARRMIGVSADKKPKLLTETGFY